jgi:hypothetical protein
MGFIYYNAYQDMPAALDLSDSMVSKPGHSAFSIKPGQYIHDFTFSRIGPEESLNISGELLYTAGIRVGHLIVGPSSVIKIKKPHVVINENNNPIAIIVAQEAVIGGLYQKDKDLYTAIDSIDFIGAVMLKTANNDVLNAERMTLNSRDKNIKARGNCLLHIEGKTIKAYKVKSDIMLKDYEIEKRKGIKR